jgi:hypothetical protein
MLKAKGWRAIALTGLLVGLTGSPALGDTSVAVIDFIQTVKSGWKVKVGTPTLRNEAGNQIIVLAYEKLSIELLVKNDQIATSEIERAIKFLVNTARVEPTDPNLSRLATLLLQATELDPGNPGPVPSGFRLIAQQDGSMKLTDGRGTVQDYLPKGASLFDKEKVVTSAMAKRSANGLISTRQRVLPASSPVLEQAAVMVKGDVDIAMQGNISVQRKQEITYNSVRNRVTDLQWEVYVVLVQKNNNGNTGMPVKDLIQACQDNKFAYEPPGQDGWFAIRDPNEDPTVNVIAVGRLTPDGLSVSVENLMGLLAQIGDRRNLIEHIMRYTPEEVSTAVDMAAQEVTRFMELESKADPTMTPPKGPDREDPNGENGGGGNLLR